MNVKLDVICIGLAGLSCEERIASEKFKLIDYNRDSNQQHLAPQADAWSMMSCVNKSYVYT